MYFFVFWVLLLFFAGVLLALKTAERTPKMVCVWRVKYKHFFPNDHICPQKHYALRVLGGRSVYVKLPMDALLEHKEKAEYQIA